MKTQTRSTILQIIQQSGGTRPIELIKELDISPQAIHRHLRSMVAAGQIETRGRGPRTRYYIA